MPDDGVQKRVQKGTSKSETDEVDIEEAKSGDTAEVTERIDDLLDEIDSVLEENAEVFLFGERGLYAPTGILGGNDGAKNIFTYEQDDGNHHPPLVSKMHNIKIKKGQHLRLETPGGGGYGPAHERDPQAVANDVKLGYVTAKAAEQEYLVVVNENASVDNIATQKLRAQ